MHFDSWCETSRYFDFRGRRVVYHEDGGGPVLLLIHGFPTSSWDWYRVWAALRREYRLIAPDMLGFGLTEKPRGHRYSLLEQCDLHEALLGALGIEEAHILAHDYGDSVAQELMARQREGRARFQVSSVCMLNGGIVPSAHQPRRIQTLLEGPLGPFISLLMSEGQFRRSFRAIFGAATQPSIEELETCWAFIRVNGGDRIMHRLIRYMRDRREHAERWVGVLREPPVPLRLIFGAADPISGRHMTVAFKEVNPKGDVVLLEEIGHYPQLEAAGEVVKHFKVFMERVNRSGEK